MNLLQYLKKKNPDYNEKELYARILCGEVRYGGEVFRNPKVAIKPGKPIEFLNQPYVSRGGDKLKGLIDFWNLSFKGKTVLDAGSSTGGFTDCVLQEGAQRVYAVDVGYNQLDYRLRQDERVSVMERTNIMAVSELSPAPDIAVADLSFRSITGAAGHIINQVVDQRLYALIKPQFEISGKDDFQGILTDPEDWKKVLIDVWKQLNLEHLGILRAAPSPVKGRKGNQEFFYEIVPLEESLPRSSQRDLIEEMLLQLNYQN